MPYSSQKRGTGRHAILRRWWGNPLGFGSPLRHYRNIERESALPLGSLFPALYVCRTARLNRVFGRVAPGLQTPCKLPQSDRGTGLR
jgi:hypothetical protein